ERVRPGLGDQHVPERVEADRERHGAWLGVHHRRGRQQATAKHREDIHGCRGRGYETTKYVHELLLPWHKDRRDAAAPIQSPGSGIRYGQTVPERGVRSDSRYASTVLSTQVLPCMYEVWPSPFQPTSTPPGSFRDSATAHWYGVAGSCRSPTPRIGRP